MDLPRFAIVKKNTEMDYWELLSMSDLMRYEQAKKELDSYRNKGNENCYLVALAFIAGPSTEID